MASILVVYALLLVMFIIASLYAECFLTARNLGNILRQAAFLGTATSGQILVILSGGIDLSIG